VVNCCGGWRHQLDKDSSQERCGGSIAWLS
jgi:hypothetical protein